MKQELWSMRDLRKEWPFQYDGRGLDWGSLGAAWVKASLSQTFCVDRVILK